LIVFAAGLSSVTAVTWSQETQKGGSDPAALKRQVSELVQQLDTERAAARDDAQRELLKLGPAILPLLPAADAQGLTAEQKRRLAELRVALSKATGKADPGRVTLKGAGLTLTDVLAAIQKQTGNDLVDLREEFGQEVTNPDVDVDWKDTPFWTALDELAAKARVGYYLDTGDRRAVGIVAVEGMPPNAAPKTYTGPFRLVMGQIVRRLVFEAAEATCTVQLEIAWEPRLRPILFEQDPADLDVTDDQGRKIEPEAPETAVAEGGSPKAQASVDSSMIRTDFILNLKRPPAAAEAIKLLKGKLNVLLPADVQTFRFRDLAKAKDAKSKKGDVSITLQKFKDDGGVWAFDLLLEFEGSAEAFESYETWFLDNEIYLERPDGTRFAHNGGLNTTESGEGRVGLQYLFVDAPGKIADYQLVYKCPSRIERLAVPYEFKDLKLP
jgi:hypothetical protein